MHNMYYTKSCSVCDAPIFKRFQNLCKYAPRFNTEIYTKLAV